MYLPSISLQSNFLAWFDFCVLLLFFPSISPLTDGPVYVQVPYIVQMWDVSTGMCHNLF